MYLMLSLYVVTLLLYHMWMDSNISLSWGITARTWKNNQKGPPILQKNSKLINMLKGLQIQLLPEKKHEFDQQWTGPEPTDLITRT